MDAFEAHLANATCSAHQGLLAALGFVLDSTGRTVYQHTSGRRNFGPNAPFLDEETTIFVASAGNFITHLATLQLVERGVVELDEPIFRLLPELDELPIISWRDDSHTNFVLRPRTKPMTLRHILTHSSGIASDEHELIQLWHRKTPQRSWSPNTHPVITRCSLPLLFEPSEGWHFGHSTHWLQLLITRASSLEFIEYINQHIFQRLNMTSSAYLPSQDLLSRSLQLVERTTNGTLIAAPNGTLRSLMCSISDMKRILLDLISPYPALISSDFMTQFLAPAFTADSTALSGLRADIKDYAAPAGLTLITSNPQPPLPPVNFTLAGSLVATDTLPLSHFPAGTATWNGSPNVVWAVNRERGLAMFFATQLLPEDDEVAVDVMMEFFRGANATFMS